MYRGDFMDLIELNNRNLRKFIENNDIVICLIYDKKDVLYHLSRALLKKVKAFYLMNIKICQVNKDLFISNYDLFVKLKQYDKMYSQIVVFKSNEMVKILPNFCKIERVIADVSPLI